jgi:hypothetical protein|tara:strand:+ start:107 stop:319 length:213 start_codon:yes stop_codon:yes gene_type:complete
MDIRYFSNHSWLTEGGFKFLWSVGWELVNTQYSLFKVLCVIKKPINEDDAFMGVKMNNDFRNMREMYEKN